MSILTEAFMSRMTSLIRPVRHFAGEVVAFNATPLPIARTLRNGLSISAGFILFAATGHFESAVICAIFTNFLVFVDQLAPIRERLWILAVASLCFAAAGAIGGLVSGLHPVVFLATFAFASFAGLVQGSVPGIELIPRNMLICFVIGAYLPQVDEAAVLGVAGGAFLAIFGAYCEHRLAPNRRGVSLATARKVIAYRDSRFVGVYGAAAASGLALGYFIGDIKPYWVTLTTLVVMQPARHANMLRVTQRFLGTIAGVLAASAFTALATGAWQRELLVGFAILTPFFWHLAFARNYGLGVAVLSFWILCLLDLALPPQESPGDLFMSRLIDTALGCALALAANFMTEERIQQDPV